MAEKLFNKDDYGIFETLSASAYQKADGRIQKNVTENLLHEHILDVFIQETHALRMICTAGLLRELVLGRLLTEGYIRVLDDVERLSFNEDDRCAEVLLKRSHVPEAQYLEAAIPLVSTCSTDHVILAETQKRYAAMKALPPASWEKAWIWTLLERFEKDTRLHQLTHATHSAYLSQEGEILFEAEDIGRHNAMDKVIGMALQAGTDLSSCVLFTSGRIPVDMVRKVIMAGIPILVSKEAPTWEGAMLAKKNHLTLIGNVKNGEMVVF